MKGLAIASLIFGIMGILFCWFGIGIIPAALALVFAFAACFNRRARGIAVMGLILGIIGATVSTGIIYALVYCGKHPQIVWQTGEKQLEDFMEKQKVLEEYSEEVIETASENADVPRMLIVMNPRSYMELVINELKRHPEKYPTKAEQ